MMKIIFLDIDGVLTTTLWSSNYREFNPVCTNALLKLLDADDSIRLVISSTWRTGDGHAIADMDKDNKLYKQLNKYGLIEKLHPDWRTVTIHDAPKGLRRGTEIQAWLDSHDDVDNYLILDDDNDMLPEQMNHFVVTDTHNGILLDALDKAIVVLGIDTNKVKWNTDFIECKLIEVKHS